jgi:hypothetical protein
LSWITSADQHIAQSNPHLGRLSSGTSFEHVQQEPFPHRPSEVNLSSFQQYPSGDMAISSHEHDRTLFTSNDRRVNTVQERWGRDGPRGCYQLPKWDDTGTSIDHKVMEGRFYHGEAKDFNCQEFSKPSVVALENRGLFSGTPSGKSASPQVGQIQKQQRNLTFPSEERPSVRQQAVVKSLNGEQIQLIGGAAYSPQRTAVLSAQAFERGQPIPTGSRSSVGDQSDGGGVVPLRVLDSLQPVGALREHSSGQLAFF